MVPFVSLVVLTEKAASQVKKLMASEGSSDSSLRVSVTGGGCSGLSYKLSFDKLYQHADTVIEQRGIYILVDKKSQLFLKGTIIDFEEGLEGKGFVFNNPVAKNKCGCGTSFST